MVLVSMDVERRGMVVVVVVIQRREIEGWDGLGWYDGVVKSAAIFGIWRKIKGVLGSSLVCLQPIEITQIQRQWLSFFFHSLIPLNKEYQLSFNSYRELCYCVASNFHTSPKCMHTAHLIPFSMRSGRLIASWKYAAA